MESGTCLESICLLCFSEDVCNILIQCSLVFSLSWLVSLPGVILKLQFSYRSAYFTLGPGCLYILSQNQNNEVITGEPSSLSSIDFSPFTDISKAIETSSVHVYDALLWSCECSVFQMCHLEYFYLYNVLNVVKMYVLN